MASPYPQYPPPGPYGPGLLARPAPPGAVRRATNLILAGAALAVVYGVVDGLTSHNSVFFTYTSTPSGTTVHQANSAVSGIIGGVIQGLLWLWMAWKTKEGRSWARVLSTVFFGIFCLAALDSLVHLASDHDSVPAFLVDLAGLAVGLAALIQLWRPESSQFFAAARQAKLATALSAPHPGVPYPGSQPPQEGGPQQPPQW
jgi:uncharacterized membrane protein (UPF0136 family)